MTTQKLEEITQEINLKYIELESIKSETKKQYEHLNEVINETHLKEDRLAKVCKFLVEEESRLIDKESKSATLSENIVTSERKLQKLSEEIIEKTSQQEKILSELAIQLDTERLAKKKAIDELDFIISQKSNENNNLTIQIQSISNAIEESKKILNDLTISISEKTIENTELNNSVTGLEQIVASKHAEIKSLKLQADLASSEVNREKEKIASFQKQMEILERQRQEKQNEIDAITKQKINFVELSESLKQKENYIKTMYEKAGIAY